MRCEALVKFMAALQEAKESERPPGGTSSIATWMSTSGGREESSAIGSLGANGSAARAAIVLCVAIGVARAGLMTTKREGDYRRARKRGG